MTTRKTSTSQETSQKEEEKQQEKETISVTTSIRDQDPSVTSTAPGVYPVPGDVVNFTTDTSSTVHAVVFSAHGNGKLDLTVIYPNGPRYEKVYGINYDIGPTAFTWSHR